MSAGAVWLAFVLGAVFASIAIAVLGWNRWLALASGDIGRVVARPIHCWFWSSLGDDRRAIYYSDGTLLVFVCGEWCHATNEGRFPIPPLGSFLIDSVWKNCAVIHRRIADPFRDRARDLEERLRAALERSEHLPVRDSVDDEGGQP